MKRTDFTFDLPSQLIAQHPPSKRTDSQLMWLDSTRSYPVTEFSKILDAFRGDEVLVLNNTRVVPARFYGRKATGGRVEIFFVQRLGRQDFKAMLRGKRLKEGQHILLEDAEVELLKQVDGGIFNCRFHSKQDLWAWLENHGETPLPPYIKRDVTQSDTQRYQTVYARERGAVAAPTAGLHFTEDLIQSIRDKGVAIATVTLHVGLGTFMPMRVDDLNEHVMHHEHFSVPKETQALLGTSRPIIAVGTTVVRALESFAASPDAHETDLFIYPGYRFQLVDGLVTNFHLPESTLLMMICAFYGMDETLSAYEKAVENGLRFFSYGDAMLIRRPEGKWT